MKLIKGDRNYRTINPCTTLSEEKFKEYLNHH